jgi:Glycosyl hydrolases family 15
MTETTITDVALGRSGYGSAPLTVSVYNFDPSLGCDDATFQPCSPRALSSLKVVGDRFKAFFPISQNYTDKQPPFYGFFTEDQFIGGHVRGYGVDSSFRHARLTTHTSSPSHNSSRPSTRLSSSMMHLSHGTLSGALVSQRSTSSSGANLTAK